MNGEIVPVQIRIWFKDGGYYDLRGTLDKLETDREFDNLDDFGGHRIYHATKVQWSLQGTMEAWEFDKNGRPDLHLRAPVARQVTAGARKPYLGGPDRSKRARRRARSRSRKRQAPPVHRDRSA